MKKFRGLCTALAAVMLSGCIGAIPASAEEVTVLATYDSLAAYAKETQGADNWYYYEYSGGKTTEMNWEGGSRGWRAADGAAYIKIDAMGPSTTCDADMVFKSDFKGVIRIKSSAVQSAWTQYQGDGTVATISKNSTELWSEVVKGATPSETELTVSVKKGDEIHFRVNYNSVYAYDAVAWWPVVERIQGEYVNDDSKYTYLQYDGSAEKQLVLDENYNDGEGRYLADDGIAFMSDSTVMPTDKYSIIKRCSAESDGRYRISGYVESTDSRSGGNIVTVSQNGEEIWSQLCVENEKSVFDVRAFAKKGDVFDVKVSVNTFTGYNASGWDCSVVKFMGTLPCEASTVGGGVYSTISERPLGELASAGSNEIKVYTLYRDKEYPMSYDSANKVWNSTLAGDGGMFGTEKALPGRKGETVVEQTVMKDGIIRIMGDMPISANSDGVLVSIYLNGKRIWSNRVGGERSVRWDERFDTSYFLNTVNAAAKVKEGDVIKYTFNHWKTVLNDDVRLKDIKIKYVTGGELSKTTKWKLKRSVIADTKGGVIYNNGTPQNADIYVGEETTYIAKNDISKLGVTGEGIEATVINGKEYIPIRAAAESAGKSVDWAAGRYVLIYNGIPVMFGWSEKCEIALAAEEGGLSFE